MLQDTPTENASAGTVQAIDHQARWDSVPFLDRSETQEMMEQVDLELASLKSQIESANAVYQSTGVRVDADWRRRAEFSRRMRGRLKMRLQNHLGDLRELQKQSNIAKAKDQHPVRVSDHLAWLHSFRAAAKIALPRDEYDRICVAASELAQSAVVNCRDCHMVVEAGR